MRYLPKERDLRFNNKSLEQQHTHHHHDHCTTHYMVRGSLTRLSCAARITVK